MPFNTNDPNYQTKHSRVFSFNDFEENIRKEKEDLEKIDRDSIKPDDEYNRIPGNPSTKYNRVTRKLDKLSKSEVKDKLKSIEDEVGKSPKHKWKTKIPTQQSSKNESNEFPDELENSQGVRVLLVSGGDDFHAIQFENEYGGTLVKDIINNIYEYESDEWELSVYTFECIDPKFVEFIKNIIMDYDRSKTTNFYLESEVIG